MDNPHQDDTRNGPRVVETATQARQGSWGRQVFMVLVVGLLLAMLAWVAIEIWGEDIDDDATQSTVSAQENQ